MPKVDISSLEGWLTKKRGPGKQKVMGILSGDTKRWFQVKELNSANIVEITLCYFKSQHEKEARGWIYMKDVTDLYDDGKTITIVSVARSITVEAKSRAEHKFWLEGIANLCPLADKSGLQTEIKCYAEDKDDSQNSSRQNSSRRGSFDVKDTSSGKFNREKGSLKLIAESKGSLPNSARSSRSGRDTDADIDDRGSDRYTSDRDSSSRDSNFNKERDRERGSSSREGRARAEGRDRSDNNINILKNQSRDDSHRESKGGNSHRDKDNREDHRVSSADGPPVGRMGIGEGATTRLHSHIRKDVPLSPKSSSHKNLRNNTNNQPQEDSMRDKDYAPAPRQYTFPPQYIYEDAPDDDIETLENSVESLPSSNHNHGKLNEKVGEDSASGGTDGKFQKPKELETKQKQKLQTKTYDISSDESIEDSRNYNDDNSNVILPDKKSPFSKNQKSSSSTGRIIGRNSNRSSRNDDVSSEEEEGAAVDLKIEKEKRNSHNNNLNEKNSGPATQHTASEGSGQGPVVRGRPPLPPNGSKPNPYTAIGKMQPSSSYSTHASNNQVSRDSNLNDDWDDSDEEDDRNASSSTNRNNAAPSKISGQGLLNSGVRADNNWLNDDFDDD